LGIYFTDSMLPSVENSKATLFPTATTRHAQLRNSEERLGPALRPHRDKVFLACKTSQRLAKDADADLTRSLQRLKTDHFDLYQCHGVSHGVPVTQVSAWLRPRVDVQRRWRRYPEWML
jgi:aryl-alcohol dehydrogenase-like predicted oxidoreductase